MMIVHRISLRATKKQLLRLRAMGVSVPEGTILPGGGDPHVAFDVGEDHPNWATIEHLIRKWDASDLVSTKFSKEELATAAWLDLVPDWHHGYPQPEQDLGYLRVTYDLSDWCGKCGIGLRQHAPFRMRSEPKWGRRSVLQLNWVFDEFFVTPEAWSSAFKPHGIACRPVLSMKGDPLQSVVQIVVEEEVGITTEGLTADQCPNCMRVKYLPITRGLFPRLTATPTGSISRTKEYFGSGASAHRRVLVSQRVARGMITAAVRGASFWPVQTPNGTS